MKLAVPLSAAELDMVTGDVTQLEATTFYDYIHDATTQPRIIESRRNVKKPALFVMWVRKHWVAAEIDRHKFSIFVDDFFRGFQRVQHRYDQCNDSSFFETQVPREYRGRNDLLQFG